MSDQTIQNKHYQDLSKLFPEVMSILENLGSTIRRAGPIEGKTTHLIQLAAAAALQSEGSVHSHTRRAIREGATQEEIYHSLLLLISAIGFPKVAAAVSWVQDVFSEKVNA
jgi:4-carboxymuconolactone decarboxylase